jgi:hypothetical protein
MKVVVLYQPSRSFEEDVDIRLRIEQGCPNTNLPAPFPKGQLNIGFVKQLCGHFGINWVLKRND